MPQQDPTDASADAGAESSTPHHAAPVGHPAIEDALVERYRVV